MRQPRVEGRDAPRRVSRSARRPATTADPANHDARAQTRFLIVDATDDSDQIDAGSTLTVSHAGSR